MTAADRARIEERIAALVEAGDFTAAATAAIRGFGPEVLGYLAALHGDRDAAGEAFSLLCEDVWRGLPSFERRASFRTWLYVLARHAASRRARRERRHDEGRAPLSAAASLAAEVRSTTPPHLRSATRRRLDA